MCEIVKNPILLVDNDTAGKIATKDAKKKINIVSLKEVNEKFETIEDLFVGKDKTIVEGDNKSNRVSRHIKNNYSEIEKTFSKETIKSFEKLFGMLEIY